MWNKQTRRIGIVDLWGAFLADRQSPPPFSLSSTLQVKKPGNSALFKAEVLGKSDYSDLALIRVPDEGFWEGVEVRFPPTSPVLSWGLIACAARCRPPPPRGMLCSPSCSNPSPIPQTKMYAVRP